MWNTPIFLFYKMFHVKHLKWHCFMWNKFGIESVKTIKNMSPVRENKKKFPHQKIYPILAQSVKMTIFICWNFRKFGSSESVFIVLKVFFVALFVGFVLLENGWLSCLFLYVLKQCIIYYRVIVDMMCYNLLCSRCIFYFSGLLFNAFLLFFLVFANI